MVSGESHYVLGRRYLLEVVPTQAHARVMLRPGGVIELRAPLESTVEQRARVLAQYYRRELGGLLPPLLGKWQDALGVRAAAWGIKRMKTKWGACNPGTRRVWFNLELAKKPEQCIEYVVVHELSHLLERHHGARFEQIMDAHLPMWRALRRELNASMLAHEAWTC